MIDRHCDKQEDLVFIDDIIIISDSVESFHKHLCKNFDISKIERSELITRGQSSNEAWYLYRKGVITSSKGHKVRTKMKKVKKGGSYVNLWELFQKVSGLVLVIPSMKMQSIIF